MRMSRSKGVPKVVRVNSRAEARAGRNLIRTKFQGRRITGDSPAPASGP